MIIVNSVNWRKSGRRKGMGKGKGNGCVGYDTGLLGKTTELLNKDACGNSLYYLWNVSVNLNSFQNKKVI